MLMTQSQACGVGDYSSCWGGSASIGFDCGAHKNDFNDLYFSCCWDIIIDNGINYLNPNALECGCKALEDMLVGKGKDPNTDPTFRQSCVDNGISWWPRLDQWYEDDFRNDPAC